MAAGQVAFSMAADVAALDALAADLAVQELSRGAAHVRQLRTLLRMHAVGRSAGMEIATVSHAALALGGSEQRVDRLLSEALTLGELPGGLEAVECGLLTVEQSGTVVSALAPLPFAARRAVWARLQSRLLLEADRGSVLPPARLGALLRGWVIEADQSDAVERRHRAEDDRRLDYRRREDGLVDLFAFGFTGPDLQAALSRVRDRAYPVGSQDERTAEQRRFDAFKDLLLGRDPLPLDDPHDPHDPHDQAEQAEQAEPSPCARTSRGGRAPCGCLPGSPVPCGAELLVHMKIGATLGISDEPAELVGHGPIESDLLQALLLSAPRLRPVWTDEHGVPVAVGDQVVVPERGDPASVRQALLHLAGLPPPPLLHPRHPQDHPPDEPRHAALDRPALAEPSADDAAGLTAAALGAHPQDNPARYRLPRRLRRLIDVRSPRCEWPGCGARAVRCDAEHDRAWPDGPTCACNLGPCCRRHHRIKQLGWTKARGTGSALTWSSPGGEGRWLSPAQHQPPAPPVRPLPPLPTADPLAELSPLQQEHELWWLSEYPEDPEGLELRAVDPGTAGPEQFSDVLGEHLLGDTRWTLDLDNPYLWDEVWLDHA